MEAKPAKKTNAGAHNLSKPLILSISLFFSQLELLDVFFLQYHKT
jgi:hypothetical protein